MTNGNKMKRYLGDGVYADLDEGGRIVLTAENGIYATNTIYLEPEVSRELIEYIRSNQFVDELPSGSP